MSRVLPVLPSRLLPSPVALFLIAALAAGCSRPSDDTPTGIPVLQEEGPSSIVSGSMDWDAGVDAVGSFVAVTGGEHAVVLRPGDLVARDEFGTVVWRVAPLAVAPEVIGRTTSFTGAYGPGVDLRVPAPRRDLSLPVRFASDPGLPGSAVTLAVETIVEHDPAWTVCADGVEVLSAALSGAENEVSFRSAGGVAFHMGLPVAGDASRASASWTTLGVSVEAPGRARVSSGVSAAWLASAEFPAALSPRIRTGGYAPMIATFHLAPAVPGGSAASLAVTYTDQVHSMLDVHINWGDGVGELFQDNQPVHRIHEYCESGTYRVRFRIRNQAGLAQKSGLVDVTVGPSAAPGFVLIPAGSFTMGSPVTELGRDSDETQHTVTLTRAFYMSAHEVTQSEYLAVMGTSPSYFSSCGGSCPVEMVSWYDAVAYCNALSASEGLTPCYSGSGSGTVCDWNANGYR
ncbi:MAG: formylglycine-generating enzyme family protein, partial [Gemmatimonadota bacterium]|nr:formylglycine-generating enzyme family protein [Gemmatimonadota bacterium]